MLTCFAATFTVSRSSDFKIVRQDGDAAAEGMHLVPVRGDLQNTRMSMEEVYAVGALQLQSMYRVLYSDKNISGLTCSPVLEILYNNRPGVFTD